MKKISVIVPTFQPQSYYLEKCLISLSNQTMKKKEYEILLILNGNKDPYEEMIKGIVDAIPDNNINVLYSMLTGVSNARNTGLDVAKGEYIAFVDDDDYVSSSYLERLYTSASPDVISLCYPLSFMDGVKTYMPYYITDSFIGGKRHYPYLKARRYFSVAVNKLIHYEKTLYFVFVGTRFFRVPKG